MVEANDVTNARKATINFITGFPRWGSLRREWVRTVFIVFIGRFRRGWVGLKVVELCRCYPWQAPCKSAPVPPSHSPILGAVRPRSVSPRAVSLAVRKAVQAPPISSTRRNAASAFGFPPAMHRSPVPVRSPRPYSPPPRRIERTQHRPPCPHSPAFVAREPLLFPASRCFAHLFPTAAAGCASTAIRRPAVPQRRA